MGIYNNFWETHDRKTGYKLGSIRELSKDYYEVLIHGEKVQKEKM
jgi:hypothetical protein